MRHILLLFLLLTSVHPSLSRNLKSSYVHVASNNQSTVVLDEQGELVYVQSDSSDFALIANLEVSQQAKLFFEGDVIVVADGNIVSLFDLSGELLLKTSVMGEIHDVKGSGTTSDFYFLSENGVFAWSSGVPSEPALVYDKQVSFGVFTKDVVVFQNEHNDIEVVDYPMFESSRLVKTTANDILLNVFANDSTCLFVFTQQAKLYSPNSNSVIDSIPISKLNYPVGFYGNRALFTDKYHLIAKEISYSENSLDTFATNLAGYTGNTIFSVSVNDSSVVCVGANRYVARVHLEHDTVSVMSYFSNTNIGGFVDFKDQHRGYVGTLEGKFVRTLDGGLSWQCVDTEGVPRGTILVSGYLAETEDFYYSFQPTRVLRITKDMKLDSVLYSPGRGTSIGVSKGYDGLLLKHSIGFGTSQLTYINSVHEFAIALPISVSEDEYIGSTVQRADGIIETYGALIIEDDVVSVRKRYVDFVLQDSTSYPQFHTMDVIYSDEEGYVVGKHSEDPNESSIEYRDITGKLIWERKLLDNQSWIIDADKLGETLYLLDRGNASLHTLHTGSGTTTTYKIPDSTFLSSIDVVDPQHIYIKSQYSVHVYSTDELDKIATSVSESNKQNTVCIHIQQPYPTPSNSSVNFNVTIDTPRSDFSACIFNTKGQLVLDLGKPFSGSVYGVPTTLDVDCSSLNTGTYILAIATPDGHVVSKPFVVVK